MKFCKAVLCRLAGLAVRVLVALAAVLAFSVFVLSEVTCITSLSLRKFCWVAIVTLVATPGCSKPSPEPPKPAEIHWRGPGTGYEDTTTANEHAPLK